MIDPAHNRRDTSVRGDGRTVKTPIEGAARAGYLDVLHGLPFRAEYASAEGQWQRNYEAGRQWGVAIKVTGQEPAEWPEGAFVPPLLLDQLARVRNITGSGTRPEDARPYERPGDTNEPVLAVVPTVRRGRIIERVAQ